MLLSLLQQLLTASVIGKMTSKGVNAASSGNFGSKFAAQVRH
jgi:hypothetical protein